SVVAGIELRARDANVHRADRVRDIREHVRALPGSDAHTDLDMLLAIPRCRDHARRVALGLRKVGTVRAVNGDTGTLRRVTDHHVAGHGHAAFRELYLNTFVAIDSDHFVARGVVH